MWVAATPQATTNNKIPAVWCDWIRHWLSRRSDPCVDIALLGRFEKAVKGSRDVVQRRSIRNKRPEPAKSLPHISLAASSASQQGSPATAKESSIIPILTLVADQAVINNTGSNTLVLWPRGKAKPPVVFVRCVGSSVLHDRCGDGVGAAVCVSNLMAMSDMSHA